MRAWMGRKWLDSERGRQPMKRHYLFYEWAGAISATALIAVLFLASANSDFRFMEEATALKLLHAKALLMGAGYTEIGRVGTPPEVLRPPGFPLLLAGIISVFGWNILALKTINNLLAPAACLLAYFLLRRRLDRPGLAAAAALTSYLVPYCFSIARALEAELLFNVLFFGAILAFERGQEDGFRSRGWLGAFAGLVGAACLTRTVAFVLLPGAWLALAFAREAPLRRRAVWAGAIAAAWLVTGGAWSLRNQLVAPPGELTYWDKVFLGEPVTSGYWLALDHLTPLLERPRKATAGDLVRRVADNAGFFTREALRAAWPGSALPAPGPALALAAIPTMLFLAGLARGLLRRRRLSDFALPLYFLVLIFYPHQDNRFLIPAAPFLVMYPLEGLQTLLALARPAASRAFLPAAAAVLAGLTVIYTLSDLQRLRERPAGPPPLVRGPHFRIISPNPGAYHSAVLLDRLRQEAAPGDRIMYHDYPPCALLSERPCSAIPLVGPQRLLQYLDEAGITLVVVDDEALYPPVYMAAFTQLYLAPAIKAYPHRFQTYLTVPGSSARVLRVMPEK
jgi:hypothetical protein